MTTFFARGYKTKLTRKKIQELLGETMPVPITEQIVASVCISPHNWKSIVADYIAAGKHDEAQKILDAVAIAAEDAITQVNVIATRHDMLGHWL